MRTARAAALGLVLALFAACSESTSGPARIAWGRDACEHCGMAISERRFAVEVRQGSRVARFDDFGCAVVWLGRHDEAAVTEIWAMDSEREEWMQARQAFYRPGQRTPMAFGFAAVGEARPGDLDFDGTRQTILERERERERADGRHPRP